MANKLLLVEDVEHLGRSGDLVSVKPGFARNYLIPNGLAVVADRNALRRQALLQEARLQQAAEDRKDSEALAAKVGGKTHTIEVKVDPEGHMYGSVSVLDIVHLVKENDGVELDKKFVQLAHAIKSTGVHTIELKMQEGVTASFMLKIVPEGMGDAAEAVTEHAEESYEAEAEEE